MARTHRDLETWKLANDLRRRIYQFTARPQVAKDVDYCRQIRRAINSACGNTSEGFYKYKHPQFAHSMRVARGELGEVIDLLNAAVQAGYLEPSEHDELTALAARALAANGGLLNYLEGNGKIRSR